MTVLNSVNTTERCAPLSPDPESTTCRDGQAYPDETTPLLQPDRTHGPHWMHSGLWSSARLTVTVSAFFDKNAGLLLVAASQFFFSAMNFSVKLLSSLDEPVPTLQLLWVRMIITYVSVVSYMCWRKVPDPFLGPKGIRELLVLRGVVGFIGISGMFFSLQHLSLSDATVLTFISPILTGFAGAVFLGESFSLRQMFSGVCSFIGVVLIARPPFLFDGQKGDLTEVEMPEKRMLSVTAGLVGVLGQTSAYVVLRAIGKQAHPLHSLMTFSLTCVVGSTIGMAVFKITPVIPTDALWFVMLLLIGIFGLAAQTLLVMGLQRETASRGTLAIYPSIVFAVIFELIVFHTTPSALSIAGTVIIMGSAIHTSLTKKTASKPTTSPTLDRLPFAHPDSDEHPRL